VSARRRAPGRDRAHLPGRARQVKLRYSDEEHSDVAAAAARSGLTRPASRRKPRWPPRGTTPPAAEPWREALLEVMAARTQVRRFGTNVNERLDGAAADLSRRLR